MKEKPNSQQNFDWFEKKYKLDFASLDPEVQALVTRLGPRGIASLVKSNIDTAVYREERLSKEEVLGKLLNISQLTETSNMPVFVGPGSRKVKNKPDKWIDDEAAELNDLLTD